MGFPTPPPADPADTTTPAPAPASTDTGTTAPPAPAPETSAPTDTAPAGNLDDAQPNTEPGPATPPAPAPDVPASTPAGETTTPPAAPASVAVGALVSVSACFPGDEHPSTRFGFVVDVDDAGNAFVGWLEAPAAIPLDALHEV